MVRVRVRVKVRVAAPSGLTVWRVYKYGHQKTTFLYFLLRLWICQPHPLYTRFSIL